MIDLKDEYQIMKDELKTWKTKILLVSLLVYLTLTYAGFTMARLQNFDSSPVSAIGKALIFIAPAFYFLMCFYIVRKSRQQAAER